MLLKVRAILLHNAVLKVVSCIIGFACWYNMSNSYVSSLSIPATMCFYNTDGKTIEAPETITLTLQGTRNKLYALAAQGLSLHINVETLHLGPNRLIVSDATLFLPAQIKLLSYIPSHSIIIVYPEKSKTL